MKSDGMETIRLQEENAETTNIVDITIKALMRRTPEAIFRLAGVSQGSNPIQLEDTSISNPELRADQVFLVGEKGAPDSGAIYLEYQLHPKRDLLSTWFTKCGGLEYQLGRPVILLALYLSRGEYASFPTGYEKTVGGLKNSFHFQSVLLWEHQDQLERGEYPELAPLLILCQSEPTLDTVQLEIDIVRRSNLDVSLQNDLLSMILSIASREFSRDMLKILFKKEIDMGLYDTVYDDWIREAEKRAEERGEERGEAKIRRLCLKMLSLRLGELPLEVVESINNANSDRCERLMEQAIKIESVSELDWRL